MRQRCTIGLFHVYATLLLSCTAVIRLDAAGATPRASQTAEYKLTFIADWSADTHPTDFPPSPHFSGLIGATHDDTTSFWSPGATASNGIKNMAETGSKSPLDNEIQRQIDRGRAGVVISGGGVGVSPGQVSVTFTASQQFPLLTLVSMIAPSPDWFVGVHDLELLQNGNWLPEVTVELQPYDAGTDSGPTYTSPNQATSPREAIFQITDDPFLNQGSVAPLGRFVIERTDQPVEGSPIITSPLSAEGNVGAAFTYAIEVIGNEPIDVMATPLPGGLSLSGTTISGTPNQTGTFTVNLSATNTLGSDEQVLILEILPALSIRRLKFSLSTTALPGAESTPPANTNRDQIKVIMENVSLASGDRIGLEILGQSVSDENHTLSLGVDAAEGLLLQGKGKGEPKSLRSERDAALGGFRAKASYSVKTRRLNLRLTKGNGNTVPVLFVPAERLEKKAATCLIKLHRFVNGEAQEHVIAVECEITNSVKDGVLRSRGRS